MSKTFKLVGDSKISIEVGKYGKFMKLYRGEKWITISERSWSRIHQNLDMITTSMESKLPYSLKLGPSKDLTVNKFLVNVYASFSEKFTIEGEERYKYINLNAIEWHKFRMTMSNIDELLNSPVVYKSDGEWSFVYDEHFTDYRFISKINDDDVNFLLMAYLVERKVESLVKDECDICGNDIPELPDNYQEHFAEHVNKNFEAAMNAVNYADSLILLNNLLNWQVKEHFFFGTLPELKQVCITPNLIQPTYCKDLALICRNTFEKLEL